jgi:hypothetical protein
MNDPFRPVIRADARKPVNCAANYSVRAMKYCLAHCLLLGLLALAPLARAQAPAAPNPAAPEAPVLAPDTPVAAPELGDVVKRLRGYISDDELNLIYDFMSNSALAALRGGEVEPLPPELEFKLAILRERLYKEGNAAMQGFMQFLQQELDQTLKKFQFPSLSSEPPPPPPMPPRNGG